MSRTLQGLICAALLGALAFFYADQIWRSYECSREPTKQVCLKSPSAISYDASVPEKTDERLADYTLWLAILTGGLVVASGIQIYFLLRAETLTRRAVDTTKELAVAAIKQANIAEITLISRERPYLFVFVEKYIKKSDAPFNSYYVEFSVTNHGVMPAIIDNAFFDVVSGKGTPPLPGYAYEGHPLLASGVIGPRETRKRLPLIVRDAMISGDSDGVSVSHGVDGTSTVSPIPKFTINRDEYAFFRIIIKYHGPFSDGHVTEATWVYDFAMSQFVPWGGKNYNRVT